MNSDDPNNVPALQLESDVQGELESLVDMASHPAMGDVAAKLAWLVDILVLRGHLAPGHRRLLDKIKASQSSVSLSTFRNKRELFTPDIDCASRLPLCQSRCCSFTVSLSAEDVLEGRVPWQLHEPYVVARSPATGYCQCMNTAGQCTVYDDRPGTCRVYDCANDPRVWIDFEKRIPAPMPAGVVSPNVAVEPT